MASAGNVRQNGLRRYAVVNVLRNRTRKRGLRALAAAAVARCATGDKIALVITTALYVRLQVVKR